MTDLILSLFSQVITCSSHPPSSFYRLNAHFSLAIAQHFFFPVSSFLGWHLQTVCHPQVKQPLHKPLSVTYARKLQVSNNNNNNHWKCFTVLFGRSSSVIHSTSCNKGRMAYPPLCGRHTAFLFKSWLCSSCVLAMLWILPIKAISGVLIGKASQRDWRFDDLESHCKPMCHQLFSLLRMLSLFLCCPWAESSCLST